MAIAQISSWLAGAGNYAAGRSLYDHYGDNVLLKALFASGESDYHFSRLQEALSELNGRLETEPVPVAAAAAAPVNQVPAVPELETFPVATIRHSASDLEWEQFPDSIKDLFSDNSRLNSRASYLFTMLRSEPDQDRRLTMCLQLLDDRDAINENWKRIRDFRENGKLAAAIQDEHEKPVAEMTAAELAKIIQNYPSSISKYRKRISSYPEGAKKDKALRAVQEKEIVLAMAKKRIDELVKNDELTAAAAPAPADKPREFQAMRTRAAFSGSGALEDIRSHAAAMLPGSSLWYKSEGAWSNHQMVDILLEIAGPAEVSFCTWAISEEAITRFIEWQSAGRITTLHAVIDNGLRNRKPHIYHQAIRAFPSLKIEHCHAKATVIRNELYQFTVIGSANFTHNPRIEVGVLIYDEQIAEANHRWIYEKINGAD